METEAREQASKARDKMIEKRLSAIQNIAERETLGEVTGAANTGLNGT